MYAIVETGGRQYRVSPGDRIDVEKLAGQVGDAITLTTVLMVGQGAAVTVGTPMVAEARVEARIVAQKRGKKIIIFKHRRRKNYRRKQGHRQWLTSLQITGIHAANEDVAPIANEDVAPIADVQTTLE
jgi:large subunit ribosomal protein L21